MIPRRSSDILSCWLHLPAGYADAGNFWEKTSLGSCFVSASWVAVVGRGLMSARSFESLLNRKCPSPKMCPNCRQYWLPSTVLGWMIFLRAPAIGSSPCHCVAPPLVVPLPLLPENWKGWQKNWDRSGYREFLDPVSRSRREWSGCWYLIQLWLFVVPKGPVTRLWWFLPQVLRTVALNVIFSGCRFSVGSAHPLFAVK